jgi:predicted TIM-barrel fold metal-dependent hydrolase
MTFDGWMYFHQIPELIELARAVPDARIVLDHLGGPAGIGAYARDRQGMLSQWRLNIAAAARMDNIHLKIGGLGFPWFVPDEVAAGLTDSDLIAAYWQPEVDFAIDAFGSDRCMLESDFPVDGRLCDYVTLWNAFKKLTSGRSAAERDALFVGTAARVYGISVPGRA